MGRESSESYSYGSSSSSSPKYSSSKPKTVSSSPKYNNSKTFSSSGYYYTVGSAPSKGSSAPTSSNGKNKGKSANTQTDAQKNCQPKCWFPPPCCPPFCFQPRPVQIIIDRFIPPMKCNSERKSRRSSAYDINNDPRRSSEGQSSQRTVLSDDPEKPRVVQVFKNPDEPFCPINLHGSLWRDECCCQSTVMPSFHNCCFYHFGKDSEDGGAGGGTTEERGSSRASGSGKHSSTKGLYYSYYDDISPYGPSLGSGGGYSRGTSYENSSSKRRMSSSSY